MYCDALTQGVQARYMYIPNTFFPSPLIQLRLAHCRLKHTTRQDLVALSSNEQQLHSSWHDSANRERQLCSNIVTLQKTTEPFAHQCLAQKKWQRVAEASLASFSLADRWILPRTKSVPPFAKFAKAERTRVHSWLLKSSQLYRWTQHIQKVPSSKAACDTEKRKKNRKTKNWLQLIFFFFSAGLLHPVHDLLHLVDGLHDVVLHHHRVVTLLWLGQQVVELPQNALQLAVERQPRNS